MYGETKLDVGKNGYKCTGYMYTSMDHMRTTLESMPDGVQQSEYDYLSSKPGYGTSISEDFAGITSKDELRRLMSGGVDDEDLIERADSVRTSLRVCGPQIQRVFDMEGEDFCQERFMAGRPDFMESSIRKMTGRRPITLVLEGCIPHYISVPQMNFAGLTVTRIVTALENAGYLCTLYAGDGAKLSREVIAFATCIRSAGDSYNPSQVLFAIHPAFSRGLAFSWTARVRPNWTTMGSTLASFFDTKEDELAMFEQLIPASAGLNMIRAVDIIKKAGSDLSDENSERIALDYVEGIIDG